MTQEEAIKIIAEHGMLLDTKTQGDDIHAFNMAISALEQEPTTTSNNNEPTTIIYPTIVCDDAISREAVIDTLYENGFPMMKDASQLVHAIPYQTALSLIEQLPSVQPSRKGHWITTRTLYHDGEKYCDKCDIESPYNTSWDFCPNCGADMRGDTE